MKKIVIIIIGIILAYFLFNKWKYREIKRDPGVLVKKTPKQINLKKPKYISFKNFTIKKLAKFEIKARVLHRKRYYFGKETKLSPVDLALGWVLMSDTSVLNHLKISQRHRFYYWRTKDNLPISKREISRSSANMHLIPSDNVVRRKLLRTRPGNIIKFEGYLVKAMKSDGWTWKSSMTRNDTGDGACEIVFVEKYEIIE